jgi:hypothetical protein
MGLVQGSDRRLEVPEDVEADISRRDLFRCSLDIVQHLGREGFGLIRHLAIIPGMPWNWQGGWPKDSSCQSQPKLDKGTRGKATWAFSNIGNYEQ